MAAKETGHAVNGFRYYLREIGRYPLNQKESQKGLAEAQGLSVGDWEQFVKVKRICDAAGKAGEGELLHEEIILRIKRKLCGPNMTSHTGRHTARNFFSPQLMWMK